MILKSSDLKKVWRELENSRRDYQNVTPIMKVEIFILNLEKFAVIVKK